MSYQPLISVVIPHFNRSTLLAETLESIFRQDYGNWEALVVDDGSDDQQWSAVQRMAQDRVTVLQRTDGLKGPSRCRNLGAAKSKGEYLVFVDSDDLLAPWCLSERMKAAKKQPDVEMWIFPVMLFRQRPGDLSTCWNRLDGEDDLERFLRSDPPWHTSSPLWRKESFFAIGGFNERVVYGDDADLHIRCLAEGTCYMKFAGALPDAFVRRGAVERITNADLRLLIDSRQSRLVEGSRFLKNTHVSKQWDQIWEGQYFREAEQLLFNLDDPGDEIRHLLNLWQESYRPRWAQARLMRLYFSLMGFLRNHFYFALRVIRRLAMYVFPASYFPMSGGFETSIVKSDQMRELQSRLLRD